MSDLCNSHFGIFANNSGTLAAAVGRCATGLIETELKIKKGLRRSPVIHADETGLRVKGKLAYVHVASSERLTHYAADVRRGKAAIDEIDILPAYRGTCVHDGWLSYTHYPDCRHALCGAHLLRELTYFEELGEVTKAWAALLLAIGGHLLPFRKPHRSSLINVGPPARTLNINVSMRAARSLKQLNGSGCEQRLRTSFDREHLLEACRRASKRDGPGLREP